jgi:hypothetical protein
MINISAIDDYLEYLSRHYQDIEKVWLIGSRLNENAHWKKSPPKDWDLVVFTDRETVNRMITDKSLRRDGIDLLVVYDDFYYVRLREDDILANRSWKDFDWRVDEQGTKVSYRAKDYQGEQRCNAKAI